MKKSEIIRKNIEDARLAIINEINTKVRRLNEVEGLEPEIELEEAVFLQAIDDQISDTIRIVLEDKVKVDNNYDEGYILNFDEISTEKLLDILEQIESQEEIINVK